MPSYVYHLLVFVSSVVELVYEILWMRRFTLLFGGTAPAGAITLSAMFFGMAVGSAVVGRLTSRWTRALQGFALLQLGTAVGAALFETILGLYDRLLSDFYPILSGRPTASLAIEAALAIAAVAVPSFFMGGILPLASHASAGLRPRLGATLGGLYSMSLLGACCGTVLVPVVILLTLGVHGGYLAAIVANIAIGLAAIAMDVRRRATTASAALPSPVAKTHRDVDARAASSTARSGQTARLLLAFLSGALVMGLEVLWSRMFSLVHENSVYSFAAMLAIFLLGLALGAALARWLLVHRSAPGRTASWAWTAAGLIVITVPRLFQAVTEGMAYEPGAAGWGALPGGTLLLAAFVLLPAVALCGVFLPLLLDGARQPRDAQPAGRVVGELLAWNTAGAIVGPLLFAFGIAPRLGLWWSIAAIGFLLVAGGQAAALALDPGALLRHRLRRLAAPVAACTALAVFYPGSIPRARWLEARGQRLVGIFEGSRGTLAVMQDNTSRWVTFNNHYTLGGTASTGDERQQAHIPLLLHPSPRQVAFLGLGTGITAGAALQHTMVQSVTIIEILPEAVEAAREYFADANLHVVNDPRTEVIVEDARAFLRFSGRRFDVIVGDLVTPWRPGEALLWSVEHFQSVRRALAP